ncbi:MAG TPA: ABC transporter permease [Gemmatimonadaceae bacterium]|nr:ABC transporter permease [Gemmatimonadaceae bacterium]
MPNAALARRLRSFLPAQVASDLFDPARDDLEVEHLELRARVATRGGRALLRARFSLHLLLLFADCWRLTIADAPRTTPAGLDKPKPTEWIPVILYHVRHAVRQLRREPAFTLAALLTLALGVGANVAVFAVVEAMLLRPLPYAEAEALVILNHRDLRTGITKEFIALGDYIDLSQRQTSLAALAAYGRAPSTLTVDGDAFRVDALLAGPGLMDVLRVRPALGRALQPSDSDSGAARVALLGHETWKSRLAGDPAVVGRFVKIGEDEYEIIGVLQQGFGFPPESRVDVMVPLTLPLTAPTARKSGWTFAIGRLRTGQTTESVTQNLTAVSRQLEAEFPQSNQASTYFALPLRTALLGNTRTAVLLLFGAVAVVLLIACANVANLLLSRTLGRRREMAVRMALGAGRSRLATQLLAESLVLSVAAAILGVAIAYWGAQALTTLLPREGSAAALTTVRINATVLGFTLGIVVVTAIVFGLVGMLSVQSHNVFAALGAPTRATVSAAARRATSTLVTAEVAFAIVLLIGAGLILRSFAGLLAVDPGFRTAGVTTMQIQLPADRYKEVDARVAFYRRAFEELRALPGTQDVGAGVVVPLTGNNWTVPFERADQPVPEGERPPDVGWQVASGSFFRALQIPLVAGRLFDDRERPGSPPVVIVSEAIQRRFFPNGGAVGQQIKLGSDRLEIVGVVGDIRRAGLRDEPRADMYFPFERAPGGQIALFVRSSSDADVTQLSMQRALERIEPGLLILDARTLEDVARESVQVTRVVFLLLGIFAATALALAAVGIYGVMSYAVKQRTRELGTRIALGATRRNIVWLVLRQGAIIAAIGTAIGVGVGLASTRLLSSILYGVSATDPLTLSAAVTLLVMTILAACYIPARRAAAVDPMRTLSEQ